ncbi:probable protein-S-isoprenylcysteine O-methyltransferase [Benincasa hispida]|uniref:probable protein-S-isoprenylcysteine O-methyltransferase n=1 Tax=Benincasa hispida TaxID=102211 RepID=UPI00190114A0|nr:probable protein-S-isoprenylcysteine O-methyltransferase [Benincasa hispida]
MTEISVTQHADSCVNSEYILAVGIHGRWNVTLTSLLISKNYLLAMILSFLEYFLEIMLCPSLKEYWWVSQTGLTMVIVGEIIRKLAIITAGRCFIQDRHKLATHGVYSFVRHPGYSGFLVWAVGTQIMVCNPLSTIAFAVVVSHFFAERIPYEEYFLRQFFGHEYEKYTNRVSSGVPFVK